MKNNCTMMCLFVTVSMALSVGVGKVANADDPQQPKPTFENVSYGEHRKQKLHFWQVESESPTPLVFYIHGGGWRGGDPQDKNLMNMLPSILKAGISVVSVQYRYIKDAEAQGIMPPVKAPMEDAARALQFVRSKASQWNIDPERIGACGGSAGGCTSLWLAFHDDLADPESEDPIARQSTRLFCSATIRPQTSLDPKQMKEWTPNSKYGSHAFGIYKPGEPKSQLDFPAFLARRDEILDWINAYSPYALVTSDDPPTYMFYSNKPAIGKKQGDPTHTANFGVKLQERLNAVGVESELFYPGAPDAKHKTVQAYLIDRLK
ncbi:alpha/beta hydrolase fold [Neorhodopirellula lusitana]|uniref:Alpha/beta hydrolase fold n=1 Tax=Neorhodopirellula lusitana TaxID=445327 RepID=A0ABY1QK53_9BACT|nr:alpha/beta hydrolase [Neorhodopirellula lusitana]SMP73247.1 alpha/beta hydrolase fold [Neorhodopirellula lusitana]